MRLPEQVELRDSDAEYLYQHDKRGFFGRKSWYRYVYMSRFYTIIDFIKQNANENSTIIDVGCAQGNFTLTLAEIGYNIYGIDLRLSFIAYAKLKMSTTKEKSFTEWIVADAKKLPFQGNSTDCILLLEILEHTTTPEKMVEEAYRILKRGGYLIVSTVNQKRIRMSARPSSYFCFKEKITKNVACTTSDSTAKGNEHVFEFQMMELLRLLRKFNFAIVNIKWITPVVFRPLTKLFDINVLRVLEEILFKLGYLKEKIAMGFIFFCMKR